ncbi:BCS1 N terminal-domain-containing protein [Aspergillus avenaceus]|uniref:BCS1 N terminal-domain-containing protein n=1 Tax=Aspergillus avenaceus TaxID=36643 RepID=A0A5N6U610_ASPAV|nr:BCS1 N terminal-domain-containing protein [Aspergillus avenaceus]
MESPAGKLFYFSSFAVGSYIVKTLLEQHGTLPLDFFYSTIEVQSQDDAYQYLLYWLTKNQFNENKNRLRASTSLASGRNYWSDSDSDGGECDDLLDTENNADTEWKASLANTRQLIWSPSEGTHYFKYRGRYLGLTREVEERAAMSYSRTEKLRISCLGWDASVLKQLLLEARVEYSQKEKGKTVIYRAGKRPYDNEFYWARSTSRPARALSTVILDHEQKHAFLQDVQQYLHPSTMKWYSDRGIPYRRGYLFHGPPGTGKSSLAFAAAGFLGLNTYILNLNAHQLNEDSLAELFQELPRRCLVLLEDIDTNEMTSRRGGNKKKGKGNNRLSLSALLNTIDGVAAQEGRVLIMTTNHPEDLDPALVRPGRVDYQIEFKLANRDLTLQMFQNLFRDALPSIRSNYQDNEPDATSRTQSEKTDLVLPVSHHEMCRDNQQGSPVVDMKQLAVTFADKIPIDTFSPAEIQGYLLCHRESPVDAVEEAEAWVQKTLDERKQRELDAAKEAEADLEKEKRRKRRKSKKNQKKVDGKDDDGQGDTSEMSSSESGSDGDSDQDKKPNGAC